MVKEKGNTVKTETKNTGAPKKNNSEKLSKESSESVSQTEKASTDAASTVEQSESSASKKENYVRGESQKPVTKAYRNNWNRIFK